MTNQKNKTVLHFKKTMMRYFKQTFWRKRFLTIITASVEAALMFLFWLIQGHFLFAAFRWRRHGRDAASVLLQTSSSRFRHTCVTFSSLPSHLKWRRRLPPIGFPAEVPKSSTSWSAGRTPPRQRWSSSLGRSSPATAPRKYNYEVLVV